MNQDFSLSNIRASIRANLPATKKTSDTLHITQGRGKMQDIRSLNASALGNNFCQKMAKKPGTVCTGCYAIRYEKMRPALESHLVNNGRILSASILTVDELPAINDLVFRFNSFGELINQVHFANLLQICNKNPTTLFALWTKRVDIVNKVLGCLPKPENLILIKSSSVLNRRASLPVNFDKVFTVYSKKEKPDNVAINCHSACASCLLCYSKNSITHINEYKK